jgi:mRNA interferase RelE/StbE
VTYQVVLAARARRALSHQLPESVAIACMEFLRGPLTQSPRRVGKPLRGELEGRYSARRGEFRIVYRIDDDKITVEVIDIRHRRDIYRG